MTAPLPVRPPPTTPALDVPADFDAGMIERWRAWQVGRAESAQTAARARLVLTAAAVAAVVFGILRTR